eukprot:CAMPEP_0194123108 /NCGR_PEP_ID=MMETSP0150-20130528/53329_1 /TAXON_ID=122233 /ORGANISM="Chaetoceros debilis, Strain MM31A-1" /LENGTH=369 /DNA_ID=CAMNT_0038816229 /DNA_START=79 /DNA_END=1185 /DNA_ORIENTATION=+
MYDNQVIKQECKEVLNHLCQGSEIFERGNDDKDSQMYLSTATRVKEEDIKVGAMLGSGAFSDVRTLKIIRFQQSRTEDTLFISDSCVESRREASTTRSTMKEAIIMGENGSQDDEIDQSQIHRDRSSKTRDHRQLEEAGYAIKKLRDDLSKDDFQLGAIHLAIETEFLAKLCHPNIVTLFGVGERNPGDANYFLILEHLGSTLYEEIRNWNEEIKYVKLSGSSKKEVNSDLKHLLTKRIDVARQISAGIMYLHEKSIIFRDLKPENIAIGGNFRVKIFDFGTAKELKPDACRGPNRFAVTGRTGTPRYMAPEVYFCECYGFPSDIFSFSLARRSNIFSTLMLRNDVRTLVGAGQIKYRNAYAVVGCTIQ